MSATLLEVRDLTVEFPGARDRITVVDKVSFELSAGSTLGLVGESGSGKSVTALSIAGLIGYSGGQVIGGSVRLNGRELLGLRERERAEVLGNDIGMVFQQPTRSLNPTMRVGDQIVEVIRRHRSVSKADAWKSAVNLLDQVKIPDPDRRARDFPYTFSGGMSQRVMIAIALATRPKLLIADEPTTALDVTVQAAVLDLLAELQRDTGISTLLITHNLGVVARSCDDLAVMYCGQIVETGSVSEVLSSPSHPYTEGLLKANPVRGSRERLVAIPGTVPRLDDLPPGCRFAPRCEYADPSICTSVSPELVERIADRADRCLHPSGRGPADRQPVMVKAS